VFLLFLFVGSYYSLAGLNKIIDVGIVFPFTLDLEKWNLFATQTSIFVSIRNYFPEFTNHPLMMSSLFSDISGIITLIVELFFVGILFLPRYRFFFIISMIIMHILVYYTHAINFLGSSVILLLCFDWNIFFREINLIYDDDCGFCKRSLRIVKRFDFFNKIVLTPSYKIKTNEFGLDNERLLAEMSGVDENSEVYYGADAFEQVFSRIFVFWPIAILMKVPFVIFIARAIYKWIAKNRSKLSDEGCEI
jgi:predicted DCC family thiol-disulfide oxidoreductase YuxK